jgi:phosphoribosylformylglycinamidine cyclo-ligase
LSEIGGFGAFFDARFQGMKSPVLVSSVDGVGTKLLVARMMNTYDTVGQDLVNHCVNDILVCGARPLFFLDYYATGSLSVGNAARVIGGFAKACRENLCSLIGGETAEMPGLYEPDEFDLAGMIVGVAEKHRIIDGRRIRKGDVLIGLPSTGLHTNGFSLARKVLFPKYSPEITSTSSAQRWVNRSLPSTGRTSAWCGRSLPGSTSGVSRTSPGAGSSGTRGGSFRAGGR